MGLKDRVDKLEKKDGEGEEGCSACTDQVAVMLRRNDRRDGQPYEHPVGPSACEKCGRTLPVQPIRIERVDDWRSLRNTAPIG